MITDTPTAAMAALERLLPHHIDVAYAFEAVVGGRRREFDQVRGRGRRRLPSIHEVRHAEFFRQRLPAGIQVHADDHVGTGDTRALHHVEADAAEPNTTTFAPTSTFAVLITAPMPVVTPQPM